MMFISSLARDQPASFSRLLHLLSVSNTGETKKWTPKCWGDYILTIPVTLTSLISLEMYQNTNGVIDTMTRIPMKKSSFIKWTGCTDLYYQVPSSISSSKRSRWPHLSWQERFIGWIGCSTNQTLWYFEKRANLQIFLATTVWCFDLGEIKKLYKIEIKRVWVSGDLYKNKEWKANLLMQALLSATQPQMHLFLSGTNMAFIYIFDSTDQEHAMGEMSHHLDVLYQRRDF